MIEGAGSPEARQARLVDHTGKSWTSSILVSGGQTPRHTTGAHRPITAESAAAGQATSDPLRLSRRRGRSGALHAGPETGEATGPRLVSRHLGEVARTRS